DNAEDLVSDLNLTYNQTRQGAITKELLEITTAALAMQ
ncbi:MAG: F0F1 ATP synthase subunit gamma, partial [Candidatus Curtissbacteria bacterium]|nr:F0F1 ATP synthase subunit gamma [Candidatus Curtissbacteria bacterium]